MKQVESTEILGKPKSVDRQAACPNCSARTTVFEDGSVMCIAEGGICFAPEPTDGELFEMRKAFDARNGISVSDRLVIPARMRQSIDDARADRSRR